MLFVRLVFDATGIGMVDTETDAVKGCFVGEFVFEGFSDDATVGIVGSVGIVLMA